MPIYKPSAPRQILGHLSTVYRDTRIPQLNPTWTAKTRAISSWHRDSFAAKEPRSARCLRRVTQPPFIAGPLVQMDLTKIGLPPYLNKFLMTIKFSYILTVNADAQPVP